jgi:hypothetical protein
MSNDAMITVRLAQEEVAALDKHTQRGLSRAQITRLLIQDFLSKSDMDQKEMLIKLLFGN